MVIGENIWLHWRLKLEIMIVVIERVLPNRSKYVLGLSMKNISERYFLSDHPTLVLWPLAGRVNTHPARSFCFKTVRLINADYDNRNTNGCTYRGYLRVTPLFRSPLWRR